ncbi:hypothetical protein KLP28_06275 [Nocardioidaceae bacterium]|nr:hypothetical protein KLP28_06275 [Nocardioidaceae bacterium]
MSSGPRTPGDATLVRDLAAAIFGPADTQGSRVRFADGTISRLDPYGLVSRPGLLHRVADAMVQHLPDRTEVIAGLELAGIPLAAALSYRTGLPAAFVRRAVVADPDAARVEGTDVRGRHVVVVDVLTDSGATMTSGIRAVRRAGAGTSTAVCVVDVQHGARARTVRSEVELVPLFGVTELPQPAVHRPVLAPSPGSMLGRLFSP